MSHQCFDFNQLRDILHKILKGNAGVANGDERKALIGNHIAAQEGALACERMVDVLEKLSDITKNSTETSIANQLACWALSKGLKIARGIKSKLPGSHNRPEFQRHRYPGIALEELKAKALRFQQLLGIDAKLKIEQISDVMFRIN
jgi:hypothetical protein